MKNDVQTVAMMKPVDDRHRNIRGGRRLIVHILVYSMILRSKSLARLEWILWFGEAEREALQPLLEAVAKLWLVYILVGKSFSVCGRILFLPRTQ